MAEHYEVLSEKHVRFIEQQKVFFMASASGAEVNLSPKGLDSLRVMSGEELVFLDFPGSGNRTARDIKEGGKLTLMFNAFEGAPLILRIFCEGELVEATDGRFGELVAFFDEVPAEHIRRFLLIKVKTVETSCGYGVPIMKFEEERPQITKWVKKKIEQGKLMDYMVDHDVPVDLGL